MTGQELYTAGQQKRQWPPIDELVRKKKVSEMRCEHCAPASIPNCEELLASLWTICGRARASFASNEQALGRFMAAYANFAAATTTEALPVTFRNGSAEQN